MSEGRDRIDDGSAPRREIAGGACSAEFECSDLGGGLLGQALAMRDGKEHLAKGYSPGGMVMPNWDLPALAGAGALRSTMNDMLKFLRANLDTSDARLPRLMQQTHAVCRPVGKDMAIGNDDLGFELVAGVH